MESELYAINPECNFQDNVPLTEEDKKVLRIYKMQLAIRLLLVYAVFALLVYVMVDLWWLPSISEIIMILGFLPIATYITAFFFKKIDTKQIFESELTYYFDHFYKYNRPDTVMFKDCNHKLTGIGRRIKTKDLQIGKRYRVHKVPNRNIILFLEKLN